jgi:hypothetical protein
MADIGDLISSDEEESDEEEDVSDLLWRDIIDSDDEDFETRSPAKERKATEEKLRDYLTGLCLASTPVTAKVVCIISWYLKQLGCKGPAKAFALNPAASSGHFSRKFRRVMRMSEEESKYYVLDVPGYSRAEMGRVVHRQPVLCPHEILHDEVSSSDSSLAEILKGMVDAQELPPAFFNHPSSIATGNTSQPIVLYVDGVPTTKSDGVLGWWVHLLASGKRHLVAAQRKSRLCRCGCKGWCSLWPIFNFIRWSFSVLASGVFPATRHDFSAWKQSDVDRAGLATLPLALNGFLMFIKGDWSEFSNTFAFSSWAKAAAPCFACCCTKLNWQDDEALAVDNYPFRDADDAMYDAECSKCEVVVNLTRGQWQRVKNSLTDGYTVSEDLPALNLRKGDHLEPCAELPDIGKFFSLEEFPVAVLFWRPSQSARVSHRLPLFCAAIGITMKTIILDLMHAFHLGVGLEFATQAIWEIVLSDVFQTGATTQDVLKDKTCELLRAELLSFYSRNRGIYTEFQEFSEAMIGTNTARKLRCKAAECKGILAFLVYFFGTRYADRLLRGDIWLALATCMLEIITVWKITGLNVDIETYQELCCNCPREPHRFAVFLFACKFQRGHDLHQSSRGMFVLS